jgi:putative transposase
MLTRRKRIVDDESSRFTEQQITFALLRAEQGTPEDEVVRKIGMSEQTSYRQKKKYSGLTGVWHE